MVKQAIVEIAGIDGSGKSTLARLLTTNPVDDRVRLITSVPPREPWFRSASAELEQHGTCSVPLEIMFRTALHARLATVQLLRQQQIVAVLDRHVISLAGFYDFKGVSATEILREEFKDSLPDKMVLLDEEPDLCFSRVIARRRPLESHERSAKRLSLYRECLIGVKDALSVPCLVVAYPYDVDCIRTWCLEE